MKLKLYGWVDRNPLKAVLLMLVPMFASLALTREEGVTVIDWIAILGTIAGAVVIIFMRARLLALFLSFSLVAPPLQAAEKPEAAAGGIVARVIVTCGFGYCIYRLGKFCAKKFPKDKPKKDPDEEELYGAASDDTDEYGGSWNFAPLGSCLPETTRQLFGNETATPTATTFMLSVFVRNESELKVSMSAETSPDSWQTWPQFQADAASHGLTLTDQADGSQFFSRNRQPVSAGEVPIRFGPEPGAVTVSSGTLVKVAIERSLDLQTWESLLTVQQPAGTAFRVLDTSVETHAFYRAKIEP